MLVTGDQTHEEMRAEIERRTGYPVTEAMIKGDIRAVRDEWETRGMPSVTKVLHEELERLRVMEGEAYANYKKALEASESKKVREIARRMSDNPDEELVVVERVVERSVNESALLALQWFKMLLQIQSERRKILNLHSVNLNINHRLSGDSAKAYIGWSPAEWEVVEGEVVRGDG